MIYAEFKNPGMSPIFVDPLWGAVYFPSLENPVHQLGKFTFL